MQTYGVVMERGEPYSPYFYYPIYDGNKNPITDGSLRTYRDNLNRYGDFFARLREFSSSAQGTAFGKKCLLMGGYYETVPVATDTQIRHIYKSGQYIIWVFSWTKSSHCGINIEDWRITPTTASNGTKVAKREVRYGGCTKVRPASVPATYAYLDRLEKEYLGSAFADLERQNYDTPQLLPISYVGDVKITYSDMQSPYYTKIWEEYVYLSIFNVFMDHRFNSAVSSAYVKAATNLPRVASNGIANVLELTSAFAALLRKDYEHALYDIKDAWLAYRYSYTTTLCDMREYSSYSRRIRNLSRTSVKTVKSHGYYQDGGFTFHVVLTVKLTDILPHSLSEKLKAFGLALDAVKAWDLIPYSFIVDWFLPISEMLTLWESHFESRDLPVEQAWMSVTSPSGDCYLRGPTKWNQAPPVLECHEASDKTILMRVADTLSLLR